MRFVEKLGMTGEGVYDLLTGRFKRHKGTGIVSESEFDLDWAKNDFKVLEFVLGTNGL